MNTNYYTPPWSSDLPTSQVCETNSMFIDAVNLLLGVNQPLKLAYLEFFWRLIRYNPYNYIIKADVCGHFNVRTLTSPPILKLRDNQGYLWLPNDLKEVINLIGVTFKQKNIFFSKKYFMSFLPHYCHSFRITVIPSVLLSFLPDYCHSFCISVIPSKYCHSFRII